jgi:hypothetical protein
LEWGNTQFDKKNKRSEIYHLSYGLSSPVDGKDNKGVCQIGGQSTLPLKVEEENWGVFVSAQR